MNCHPDVHCSPHACLVRTALLVIFAFTALFGAAHRGEAADTPGQQTDQAAAPQQARTTVSRVAPIFIHGRGCGILDLEGTNVPVFLSDAEAYEAIADEAREAGVIFSPDSRQLTIAGNHNGNSAAQGKSVMLDGVDGRLKISFAFISQLDANAGRRKLSPKGAIEEIDIRGYAASLRDRMAGSNPEGTCVVFYDPALTVADAIPQLTESEHYSVDLTQQTRQLACKELRQQVRDFIEWLKARQTA